MPNIIIASVVLSIVIALVSGWWLRTKKNYESSAGMLIGFLIAIAGFMLMLLLIMITASNMKTTFIESKTQNVYSLTQEQKGIEVFSVGFGTSSSAGSGEGGGGSTSTYNYYVRTDNKGEGEDRDKSKIEWGETKKGTIALPAGDTKVIHTDDSKPLLITYEERYENKIADYWFGGFFLLEGAKYKLVVPKETIQLDLEL